MAINVNISNSLNEQQLMMLRLFKTPLDDEDFQSIRRLSVKLLAKKLDNLTGAWEEQNDISEKTYDNLSKGHFRSKS